MNTALTVGLQLWLPRTAAGREWRRGLRAAAALLVVACCLFAVTSWLGPVSAAAVAVVAVVALTGGENAHAVAAWELSYAVAPPGRTAEYLTVFGLSLGLAGLLGPIVLAGPVLGGGPVGWLLLAVLFGAGAVLVRRCGEALLRVRVAPGAG